MPAFFLGAELVLPVKFSSKTNRIVNDMVNLKRSVLKLPGQRWSISFKLAPTTVNQASLLAGLLAIEDTVFDFTVPQPDSPSATLGTINRTVSGTVATGASSMTINSASGVLVGRYFTFANHTKLYIVTSITGNVIGFYPPLYTAQTSGASIKFGDNVTMRAMLDLDRDLDLTFESGVISDVGTINLVEII